MSGSKYHIGTVCGFLESLAVHDWKSRNKILWHLSQGTAKKYHYSGTYPAAVRSWKRSSDRCSNGLIQIRSRKFIPTSPLEQQRIIEREDSWDWLDSLPRISILALADSIDSIARGNIVIYLAFRVMHGFLYQSGHKDEEEVKVELKRQCPLGSMLGVSKGPEATLDDLAEIVELRSAQISPGFHDSNRVDFTAFQCFGQLESGEGLVEGRPVGSPTFMWISLLRFFGGVFLEASGAYRQYFPWTTWLKWYLWLETGFPWLRSEVFML
ncbi:hypothetical protein HAX54_011894 [Datura stramonium]|uniref:Uncharacterized protein n=1 Tax=Datura stramonium TaxID=4076 RepID=A0ABS8TKR8_DATST|nr:hypothetical protein [Datura stramonium]